MRLKALFIFILPVIFCSAAWSADDAVEKYDEWKKTHKGTIKDYKGIHFELPDDYPIKDHEGYISPIPFEEYAYMKFDITSTRTDALEKRVLELEERIKALETKAPAKIDSVKKTA